MNKFYNYIFFFKCENQSCTQPQGDNEDHRAQSRNLKRKTVKPTHHSQGHKDNADFKNKK